MNTKFYKTCAVPQCPSTSLKRPDKLFVYVPHNKTTRDKWLKLARRDPTSVKLKTSIYFCEDHFDLPHDMDNFMEYNLMGFVSVVRMKSGCIPTKFQCQLDRQNHQTSDITEQPDSHKKQRQTLIEEAMKDLDEKYNFAKHLELGETSSESPVPEEYKTANKSVQVSRKTKFRSKAIQTGTTFVSLMTSPVKPDHRSVSTSTIKITTRCTNLKPTLSNGGIFTIEDQSHCHSDISYNIPSPQTISSHTKTSSYDNHIVHMKDQFKQDIFFYGPKKIHPAEKNISQNADGRSHEDVCCECGADVEGFRYVCVQCSVSLCGACAARGAHPAHYVLRLPHRATQEQTDAVLSLLRAQLGGEAGDASIKFEIKEEPVDHLTDAPSMEDDNPASQDFEIFVKEEPLQEPMDEAANLQAAIMNIKKENEAIAESEYPSVESSFSVHTHLTKPNEPLIKDSAPQQLTTLEVLEPIGSQYEIEIRNEPNQVCVPGTSSQQRTKSYETFFFSKNPTKRTVPPENILLNKITKTSASVNKERKKPIVQKLVKKKVTKPMKNVNSD